MTRKNILYSEQWRIYGINYNVPCSYQAHEKLPIIVLQPNNGTAGLPNDMNDMVEVVIIN